MEAGRSPYVRSIFAHELANILALHQHSLDDLMRSPASLDRKKINPLVESLNTQRRMPALNHEEMMTVFLLFKLDNDEQMRVYAALIALGVQRLLLEYLPPERAWILADELRGSALTYLQKERAEGRNPFRRVRGAGSGLASAPASSPDPLAVGLDAFDQGTALATMGLLNADGEAGRELLEEAVLWFTRAATALDRLPPSVRASEDWRYWRQEVETALEQAKDASR